MNTPDDPPNDSESSFTKSVRMLAHYLYVLRGCQEGHSFRDWIEAESRLKEAVAPARMGQPEN